MYVKEICLILNSINKNDDINDKISIKEEAYILVQIYYEFLNQNKPNHAEATLKLFKNYEIIVEDDR